MIKRIKMAYNRWLFKKYGFNRGALFERVPLIYKLTPLWSPSLYSCCEGAQIHEWFHQGFSEEIALEKGINVQSFYNKE